MVRPILNDAVLLLLLQCCLSRKIWPLQWLPLMTIGGWNRTNKNKKTPMNHLHTAWENTWNAPRAAVSADNEGADSRGLHCPGTTHLFAEGVNLIKMCSHWLKLLFSPASIVAFSLPLSLPPALSPPLSVSRLQLSHHSSDYVPSNEKDLILYAAGERALAGHAIKEAVRVERESICVYLDKHNHAMIIIDFNTPPFSIQFFFLFFCYWIV